MEFPRTVFKNHGPIERAGGTFSALLIDGREAFENALEDGWYENLAVAIDPPKKVEPEKLEDLEPPDEKDPESEAPPTRLELEAKAKELGIRFDGRYSDKGLTAMIEKALGA